MNFCWLLAIKFKSRLNYSLLQTWWICDIFPEISTLFLGINSVASNPSPKESYFGKREQNLPLNQSFPKKMKL